MGCTFELSGVSEDIGKKMDLEIVFFGQICESRKNITYEKVLACSKTHSVPLYECDIKFSSWKKVVISIGGLSIERPDNLNVCLNCIQILRDERTTGLEENYDGERGSFVNSAGSDDRLQSFASSLHQPVSGA